MLVWGFFLHSPQEVPRTVKALRKPITSSSWVWIINCISRDVRETSLLEIVKLNTVETTKGLILYRI